MKLIYDSRKDHKEIELLVHHLLQTRKGEIINGRKAEMFFADYFGLRIDYHEYGNVLDAMERRGECKVVGHTRDGMTEYYIN